MSYNLKSESEVKEYLANLGIEYRFGCYSEKNPEVCHLLADFLEAIKKDYEKAGKVYKNNCDEFNFAKSCLKYGAYCLLGKGTKQSDFKAAYSYFDKGCTFGETNACFNQGLLLITKNEKKGISQDVEKGVKLLEKACEKEHANACYYLSGMYIGGFATEKEKVDKDMAKAFKYALKGCELGNMYSCANIGQMYAKGDGVKQNKELSEKYKNRAIEMQEETQSGQTLTFQEGLS